ncbi:phosphotransferase [Aquisalimonas lutea]|uniref:aminoglycoside phosphotransferase family protein n=1 Tax=Aquisalimonas lutea TaxID=1327750 RepID=UPI0025B5F1C8|nr:phosphotransferase [Aquisalimonas lutea]MDN3516043.1 phosphotransferase [Aquisalimonas lutea]
MKRDTRLQALRRWLADQGVADGPLTPVSSDASFRRYFRVPVAGQDRIAMDAPPEHEDVAAFVHVAGLMRGAGLNVPEILARDPDNGFLLLSDLGRRTYLDVLDDDNADALMQAALEALVQWQAATRRGELAAYDAAVLQRELQLFPDWYLARHLGVEPTAGEREAMEGVFRRLVDRALAQERVWVHRDYMPRNLMPGSPSPGILDFQDALEGPVSYDVICLLRDAFISWPRETEWRWLRSYHAAARDAGVPVPAHVETFWSDCTWMGVQRHLKVLGIFARIRYRDGKPRYLEDAPRFRAYLERAAEDEPGLGRLAELVEDWHARSRVPSPAGGA